MDCKYTCAILGCVFNLLLTIPRAQAAALPDACSLLTPAQVNAVLGISVKAGEPSPGNILCEWPPPSPTNTKRVEVSVSDSSNWAMEKAPPAGAGVETTPVNGIADDAFYLKTAGETMLYVKKGKVEFFVLVHGFPVDQVKAKEKTLAQQVLTKL